MRYLPGDITKPETYRQLAALLAETPAVPAPGAISVLLTISSSAR
jgi:hypothetical protein